MSNPPVSEITGLLLEWSHGNAGALDRLMPLVYDQLLQMARRTLRDERPEHTLQATALVHEAYLKLIDQRRVRWQERAHFFGVAAQIMRRLLVDHARRRNAAKRGDGSEAVPLDDADLAASADGSDLVELDQALKRLAAIDERQSRIVELRFFAGLTVEEVAEVLRVSTATVKNDWRVARAWLYGELKSASAIADIP